VAALRKKVCGVHAQFHGLATRMGHINGLVGAIHESPLLSWLPVSKQYLK
jgi:hypothetical protein